MRDIVVTWPKLRSLESYLEALEWAFRNGREINFRVPTLPFWPDLLEDHGVRGWPYGADHPRCYRVHDGAVRGYTHIMCALRRNDGEVAYVGGEGFWPAGAYIVCHPEWHPIAPIPMRGFQGWRWFDDAPRRSVLAERRKALVGT